MAHMTAVTLTPSTVQEMPVPVTYTPMRVGLTIARRKGVDADQAALALAANRASKIAMLADDGHVDTAARYLADLRADVDAYLTARQRRTATDERFAALLTDAATPRFQPAEPARHANGAPVALVSGLTGRVAWTFTRNGARMYAVTVQRTMDPPHPRHGAAWPELYHAAADRLRAITKDELVDHPVAAAA